MTGLPLDPRVRGFPGQVQGGYLAGVAAAGRAATVRLLRPVPAGAALRAGADGEVLSADGAVVARVLAGEPDWSGLTVPPPVDSRAARAATAAAARAANPVPDCFVCGPLATGWGGLGVLTAPLPDAGVAAGWWHPPAVYGDARGELPAPLVWAALDCPGYGALPLDPPSGAAVVTGTFTAEVIAPVRVGEPHVVTGWLVGRRPPRVAAAIHDTAGTVRALAVQTLAGTDWGFPLQPLRDAAEPSGRSPAGYRRRRPGSARGGAAADWKRSGPQR
jgi:hypothetical protein